MKIHSLAFFFALQLIFSFNASSQRIKADLFVIETDGKYGYIDKHGSVQVEPVYDRIQQYASGDVFWVKKYDPIMAKSIYLLVNTQSQLVLRDTFERVRTNFSLDKWAFGKSTGWGLVDRTGEVLIPFVYDEINVQDNRIVIAKKNGVHGYFMESDLTTFVPLPEQDKYNYHPIGEGYFSAYDKQNHYYGIFDTKTTDIVLAPQFMKMNRVRFGQVVLSIPGKGTGVFDLNRMEYIVEPEVYIDIWMPKISQPYFGEEREDSLFIATKGSPNGQLEYLIIDRNGRPTKVKGNMANQYAIRGTGFFCGVAAFRFHTDDRPLVGGVNENGELIIPTKFDQIGPASEELIIVTRGDFFGYWSSKGTEQIPLIFSEAGLFINGLAYVKKETKDGKKTSTEEGYINTDGTFIWKKT